MILKYHDENTQEVVDLAAMSVYFVSTLCKAHKLYHNIYPDSRDYRLSVIGNENVIHALTK